ncbi:MAG: GNAT family N-acetyltransferase, partial [Gemmatimonadaceae bacterium]|nr:GNAT family N-acetyltransferase [Acetobacteraceae bacterium]
MSWAGGSGLRAAPSALSWPSAPAAARCRGRKVSSSVITTERLILRTWTEADRAPFAALSRDPEVMAFVTPHPDRAASEAWIDRQVAAQSSDGFCFWAVEHSGSFVGAVGLLRVRYPAHFTPAIEVGWRISRAFWGRGFAPEAAGAALRFGFTTPAVSEIVANTIATNLRSLRVMAKI